MVLGTNSFSQFIFENHAAFHHEFHFLQFSDVLQRVAAHGHDVCPFAGFDRARCFAPAEQLRGDRGSRSNRLHRGHAILDVVLKFVGLIEFARQESCAWDAASLSRQVYQGFRSGWVVNRCGRAASFSTTGRLDG
jgi:hypothetical protein